MSIRTKTIRNEGTNYYFNVNIPVELKISNVLGYYKDEYIEPKSTYFGKGEFDPLDSRRYDPGDYKLCLISDIPLEEAIISVKCSNFTIAKLILSNKKQCTLCDSCKEESKKETEDKMPVIDKGMTIVNTEEYQNLKSKYATVLEKLREAEDYIEDNL